MHLNDYQHEALSYALPQSKTLAYLIPGLAGEVGELCSLVAKAERDGPLEDYDTQFRKELGDILWFVAMLCEEGGDQLEDIASLNIRKLAKRAHSGTIQGSGDYR